MHRSVSRSVPVNAMSPTMPVEVANPATAVTDGILRWVKANALWDTGAQICLISRSFCRKLNFAPCGAMYFSGVGGCVRGANDIVYISIFCDGETFLVAVAGVIDEIPGGHDMIIGMDVIMQGDFSLSTSADSLTISFTPYKGKLRRRRK